VKCGWGSRSSCRNAKGHCFGAKLRWTQCTRAEFVERMYLLVGVALLIWTTVGEVMEEDEPACGLRVRRWGRGSHSPASAPIYWREVSKRLRLTASFVREHLPPRRFRIFKWLMAPQK
jgi:hypothetical protein